MIMTAPHPVPVQQWKLTDSQRQEVLKRETSQLESMIADDTGVLVSN